MLKITLNALVNILIEKNHKFSIWCQNNSNEEDQNIIRFICHKDRNINKTMHFMKCMADIVDNDRKTLSFDCFLYYNRKNGIILACNVDWLNQIKEIMYQSKNNYYTLIEK